MNDLTKNFEGKFVYPKIKSYLCIRKIEVNNGPFVYRLGREIFIL